MYVGNVMLGKFVVPDVEDWPLHITYQPEPMPVVTRGALNPWQRARERALRLAEDDAWGPIQEQQERYRQLLAERTRLLNYYNHLIAIIEGELGPIEALEKVDPGMQKAGAIARKVMMSIAFFGWFPGVSQIFSMIGFGPKKRDMKKVEHAVAELERTTAQIERTETALARTAETLERLTQRASQLKSLQADMQRADVMQSEAAYARQRASEREQAAAHQAMAAVVRAHPQRRTADAL